MGALPAWFETVRLHPDVEAGNFTRATFAIDFGGVLANDPNVPLVYRDSRAFWQANHLTHSLKRLLEEVLQCLTGRSGERVLQLRSPFGGGKSHVLVALYHAVRDREAFLQRVPEARTLPDPGSVRVAGIDGEKFDPTVGMEVKGVRVRTLWGALAAALERFELVKEHEGNLTAPGGEVVKQILGGEPTLILLDEVLRYVERTMTIQVGDSTLGRQSLEFLQTLTTEVAGSPRAVLVYSLQASGREALDNVGLLSTLDHLAGRVDAKREPVAGDEILPVLKKRLLAAPPPEDVAGQVAEAVAQAVTGWRLSEAPDEASRRSVQDEAVRFKDRLQEAYPFHARFVDLMKERWASLPDFQRTRGALRFLAVVLHKCKALGRRSPLVSPGDVPLEDPEVRNAFFAEIGQQRDQFQAVLEHDLIGPNARVKRIDQQLAEQNPALSQVRPAARLATAIFMYSFGGIVREEDGEILPPGVTERELLEACLSPELDSITAQTVLKRLREECLYHDYDGTRYCFKTIPNENKRVEEEADNIRAEDIQEFIRRTLEEHLAPFARSTVIWPLRSSDIPDGEPRFILAYLPLEFAEEAQFQQEQKALDLLTNYGDRPRSYRRAVALAIPDRSQLQGLRQAAKYLMAVRRVLEKRASYKLTKEQVDRLRERERSERAALESSLRRLYGEIWLLRMEEGQPGLEKLQVGGRPLQSRGVHERLLEFLCDVTGRLTETLRAHKLSEFLTPEQKAVETKVLRDYYFGSPDAPVILMDEGVLRRAIAEGVEQGRFAYSLRSRVRVSQGVYTVNAQDAVIKRQLPDDEVDLEEGILLLPECVISPVGKEATAVVQPPTQPTPEVREKSPQPAPSERVEGIRHLRLTLHVGKAELYRTFTALGNLADRAGELHIEVDADLPEDVDRSWLRNAVYEPLDEAGVKWQKLDT